MGIDTLENRAVFFDRDGVINYPLIRDGKPYPPRNLRQLKIIPGAAKALQQLRDEGLFIIVVTNQPDVARGSQTKTMVEKINNRLTQALPLDEIRVCFHDDRDCCECRKPKPGLLMQAARSHNIDLTRSFMVGDRWRDIEAGKRAGCRTVFIDWGYNEPQYSGPDHTTGSLAEAIEWILKTIMT